MNKLLIIKKVYMFSPLIPLSKVKQNFVPFPNWLSTISSAGGHYYVSYYGKSETRSGFLLLDLSDL